jgi:glutamyl-tRNA synthetase
MPVSEEVLVLIRKYAIKNAVDYGKADIGSVLGKVIKAAPGVPIPELKGEVQAAVAMVNKMRKDDIEKEYAPLSGEFEQKARETAVKTAKANFTIEGAVEGEVVTRFPPEPGGYIHIGNLKQCLMSEEIARIYKGRIYLYFDDTNPEKCRQEFVDGIKADLAWMGVGFAKEYYASDSIEKVYEAGRRLLRQGDAYVCECTEPEVEKNRELKANCKHRNQSAERNLALFEEMLAGKYDEGQAIVRLTGEMKSDNAAFRDPTLFRIKKATHYRHGDKYVVWPTYHINTLVLDSIHGVTDVLRDKNYESWDPVHKQIMLELGLTPPRMHYEAKLKIGGTTTAKREMRELLAEGKVSGWDDPRLVTVAALRRRGILPGAIRSFVLRFGMSKTDGVVSMEMLLAENRRLIDPVAKHLFFVKDPFKVVVKGEKPLSVKLRLHPSSDMGFREYRTWDEFYVPGEDAEAMKVGELVRLKDLICVRIASKTAKEIVADVVKSQEGKVVQWVSGRDYIECSVVIPEALFDEKGAPRKDSLKSTDGYVESYADRLEAHEILQFERFGYCILDDKEECGFILISK